MKRLLEYFAVDMSIKKKLMVSYGVLLLIFGGISIIGFEGIMRFYIVKQTSMHLENQTAVVKKAIEINNSEIENYVKLLVMDDYVQSGLEQYDEMSKSTIYTYNNNIIRKSIVYGMIADNDIQCQILTKDGTVAFRQEYSDLYMEQELIEELNGNERWEGVQGYSEADGKEKAYIIYLKKIFGTKTGKLQGYVVCYIDESNYNSTFFTKNEKKRRNYSFKRRC